MPLFRPIDEMSLRHLFSSSYAQEALRLSYLGPVLSPTGTIESSPDCLVLDRRKRPFRPLRCEFKFIPLGKDDFAHNGQFDIAVVWNLQRGQTKDGLLRDLLQQNGCAELIVLDSIKAFRDLPAYTTDVPARLGNVDVVRDIAIKMPLATVFAFCVAARLAPGKFDMGRMVELLSRRFPEVRKMQPRGRANVISSGLQTKPPLIELMHGKAYRWAGEIDSVSAAAELTELIRSNFDAEDPMAEDLEAVRSE
jgi:hypothetical protein